MYLLFLFLLPQCLCQFLTPFMYDPTEMAAEMNYMNEQIAAQNKAIQLQILQNNGRMRAIPADGKVHSYVDRIPGGVSKGAAYHNRNPNGEEYAESHYSSQTFGQGDMLKENAPQIPWGLEKAYSNYLQNKLLANSYGVPAITYGMVPSFYKAVANKLADGSISEYPTFSDKSYGYSSKHKVSPNTQTIAVVPVATEVVVPQTRLSSSADIPKNQSPRTQNPSSSPPYAGRQGQLPLKIVV